MQQEKQEKRQPKKHRWLRFAPQIILGLGLFAAYFSWRDSHRKLTQQELDTALTRYMQGKYAIYGDTLTPVGEGKVQWYPSDILYPTPGIYEMRFQSEKYPGKYKEEVLRLYYNYEKETLRDNYMDFVHRNRVEEKFKEIFNRLYGSENYALIMKTPKVPYSRYDYKATETVEEFLNHSLDSYIRVYVAREEERQEKDIQDLLELLKEYQYGIDGNIYYVTQDQLNNIREKELNRPTQNFKYNRSVWIVWQKKDINYRIYMWEGVDGKQMWVERNQPKE